MALVVRGGGGAVGYRSLFVDPNLIDAGDTNTFRAWATENPEFDFARRFGTARLLERNQNLIDVLSDPKSALEQVNTDIKKINDERAKRYTEILYEFKNLGFSEEESTARADVMISREMETDLALLQIRRPYAVGGAAAGGWDPVNGMLRANPVAAQAGPTFAAIGQTGMGVSRKGGISKGEKARLKKKFKRQRKKKKAAKA